MMKIMMFETHERIVGQMKRRSRIVYGFFIFLLLLSFSFHWVSKVGNDLIKGSYQAVRYQLKERQDRYALLEILRNKPLTLGQALDIADVVIDESRANKVPIHMILGMMDLESEFILGAVSSEGARGLMQVMPDRWKVYISSKELQTPNARHDPVLNIMASVRYLGDLTRQYNGDWKKILKEYGGFVKASPDIYIRVVMARASKYKVQLEEKNL